MILISFICNTLLWNNTFITKVLHDLCQWYQRKETKHWWERLGEREGAHEGGAHKVVITNKVELLSKYCGRKVAHKGDIARKLFRRIICLFFK